MYRSAQWTVHLSAISYEERIYVGVEGKNCAYISMYIRNASKATDIRYCFTVHGRPLFYHARIYFNNAKKKKKRVSLNHIVI